MSECRNLFETCGGEDAGIGMIGVSENLDDRKGYRWIEICLFKDVEAFIAFHAHPAHTAFSSKMAASADVWIVQDVAVDHGTQILI